jgi:hypothetical protein
MLFAARASSLGAIEVPAEEIKFDAQGGLEFGFLHIKGWRNQQQKSTGRKLPFRRRGRDAVPVGVDKRRKKHFRNRCFEVIRFALDERLMKQWTSQEKAAQEITDGLEEVGIKNKVPRQVISSHSGRKTCVSAGMEMGVPAGVMQEWMLTATDQTERYRQRNYEMNAEVQEMFDFLLKRKL